MIKYFTIPVFALGAIITAMDVSSRLSLGRLDRVETAIALLLVAGVAQLIWGRAQDEPTR